MKRRLIRLTLGVLVLSAGCSTPGGKASGPAKPPEDPTAWSGSAISHDDGEGGTRSGGAGMGKSFLKSTRLRGAMSSEGAEIERSLGVN